jgi:predicted enzyme related to lactoylglutathione lyase
MVTRPILISIFVDDQVEAKKWYTEALGFKVVTEMEIGPGWYFLTVAPKDDTETVLELVRASSSKEKNLVGKQAGRRPLVMFASNDIESDFMTLKSRGVKFNGKPKEVPFGKGVSFEDLYGNKFDLYQKLEEPLQ